MLAKLSTSFFSCRFALFVKAFRWLCISLNHICIEFFSIYIIFCCSLFCVRSKMSCIVGKTMSVSYNQKWWQQPRDRDSVRCAQIDRLMLSFCIHRHFLRWAEPLPYANKHIRQLVNRHARDIHLTNQLHISFERHSHVVVCWCTCCACMQCSTSVCISHFSLLYQYAHNYMNAHSYICVSGIVWHNLVEMLLCFQLTALFYYYNLIESCLCRSGSLSVVVHPDYSI